MMLSTPPLTSENSSPASTTATATTGVRPVRAHSCILCQQRKVKCDRQKPCANCVKSRAECVESTPTVPRRRRRRVVPEVDLVAKLKRYEQLLKEHGVKIEDEIITQSRLPTIDQATAELTIHDLDDNDVRRITMGVPRAEDVSKGTLFYDKDSSHYVENTLWENLRDEIQDPQLSNEDDVNEVDLYPEPESILMGVSSVSKNLSDLHPSVVHIFRLWQVFLDNCNPLIKMIHAPTVQQMILNASGDLEKIPKPIEALMFSIYFLAITSLSAPECESMFGESRQKLLSRYTHAVQKALINARFLRSLHLTTLQALVHYILGMRRLLDPHSIWVLSGVVVRIAHRLGLHHESKSIPPFDQEIRRRTWWQVIFLDGHSSKLAGAGFPAWATKFETKPPRNISDSELTPSMKELPPDKQGATEMMFSCLRYEVVGAIRDIGIFKSGPQFLTVGPELIKEKDKAIDVLEKRFQDKYLKYCDPSIPLHLLVMYCGKSVICTMRIMAHHPRQYPDKGINIPQSEKDMLFAESLKEVDIDTMGHENKPLRGYLWFTHMYFQLDAFIYVLSELRVRLIGDMVDRAWASVEMVYTARSELITDTKNGLYAAIGNLTLKSWAKREEAVGNYNIQTPRYISHLRSVRNAKGFGSATDTTEMKRTDQAGVNATIQSRTSNPVAYEQSPVNIWTDYRGQDAGFPDVVMSEVSPTDWEYWQTLMDGELPEYTETWLQNMNARDDFIAQNQGSNFIG